MDVVWRRHGDGWKEEIGRQLIRKKKLVDHDEGGLPTITWEVYIDCGDKCNKASSCNLQILIVIEEYIIIIIIFIIIK